MLLLLLVHNSLRNFAYLGICLITSSNGMLISTFLKVSNISFSSFIFLVFASLSGKGGLVSVETNGSTLSSGISMISSSSSVLGGSGFNSFPLLRVTALTFSLGLSSVWEGNLPVFSILERVLAICSICFSRLDRL